MTAGNSTIKAEDDSGSEMATIKIEEYVDAKPMLKNVIKEESETQYDDDNLLECDVEAENKFGPVPEAEARAISPLFKIEEEANITKKLKPDPAPDIEVTTNATDHSPKPPRRVGMKRLKMPLFIPRKGPVRNVPIHQPLIIRPSTPPTNNTVQPIIRPHHLTLSSPVFHRTIASTNVNTEETASTTTIVIGHAASAMQAVSQKAHKKEARKRKGYKNSEAGKEDAREKERKKRHKEQLKRIAKLPRVMRR